MAAFANWQSYCLCVGLGAETQCTVPCAHAATATSLCPPTLAPPQFHYTYACRIRWAANASLAWQFEKRVWTRQQVMEEVRAEGLLRSCLLPGEVLHGGLSQLPWHPFRLVPFAARCHERTVHRWRPPGFVVHLQPPPRPSSQVPLVPLPPPWQPGLFIGPGEHKPPLSKEQHDLFTLLADTFNKGLQEVGGKRFREVLGPDVEPAREIGAAAAAAAAAAAGAG